MSKKVSPKALPKVGAGDSVGKQIATYRASLEAKDRAVQSFTAWLHEKTPHHFGSATPLLSHGYGIDAAIVGSEP